MNAIINSVLAVAAAAGGFVSYQNLTSAKELNKDVATLETQNRDAAKNLENREKETTAAEDVVTAETTRLNELKAKAESVTLSINEANGKISGVNAELKGIAKEVKEAKDLQKALDEIFGEPVPPAEIPDRIAALEKQATDLQKQVSEQQALVAGAEKKIATAKDTARRIREQLTKRGERIASNQIATSVLEVDNRWNFVVLGNSQDLQAKERLIVSRGTQFIGKLVVDKVENGQVVAEILDDTLAPGVRIQRGDRVLRETPLVN